MPKRLSVGAPPKSSHGMAISVPVALEAKAIGELAGDNITLGKRERSSTVVRIAEISFLHITFVDSFNIENYVYYIICIKTKQVLFLFLLKLFKIFDIINAKQKRERAF